MTRSRRENDKVAMSTKIFKTWQFGLIIYGRVSKRAFVNSCGTRKWLCITCWMSMILIYMLRRIKRWKIIFCLSNNECSILQFEPDNWIRQEVLHNWHAILFEGILKGIKANINSSNLGFQLWLVFPPSDLHCTLDLYFSKQPT